MILLLCACGSGMQSISHDVLESHLIVYALGEGKLWCFRDDSALPLENSRKSQVCPCRQPSLCQGCVFIGQGLESLALSLRLTCPDVSHLLGARGVGGRMSLQPPPSASHTVLGLQRSLLHVEWPPSPVFLPPIERRLKLSDIKIQLALLWEVRGRSPPESARVRPVEQRTGSQRNSYLHSRGILWTAWPWASHLTSLKFGFIIWRMGAKWPALLTSPGWWQGPKMTNTNTATALTWGLGLEGLRLKQKFSFGTEGKSSETKL